MTKSLFPAGCICFLALLSGGNPVQAQSWCGQEACAYLHVILPAPDATLWLQNTTDPRKGSHRFFASPPLPSGKSYFYTIKVTWKENSRVFSDERKVFVFPGRKTVANFAEPRREPIRPGPGVEQDLPLTPPLAPEPARQPKTEDLPLTPPLAPEPPG